MHLTGARLILQYQVHLEILLLMHLMDIGEIHIKLMQIINTILVLMAYFAQKVEELYIQFLEITKKSFLFLIKMSKRLANMRFTIIKKLPLLEFLKMAI